MANEVTVTADLAYSDAAGVADELGTTGFTYTVSTLGMVRVPQAIGTGETVVNLGGVAAPGFVILINRDTTNYIDVKSNAGGKIFARLKPNGGVAMLFLGSDSQVPVALSPGGATKMDALITSA